MKHRWLLILTTLLGAIAPEARTAQPTGPTQIYVDAAAIGLNNGTSWADAFTSLQTALATAASGAIVYVAEGAYFPDDGSGDRSARFTLSGDLTIEGGYGGRLSSLPGAFDPVQYQTILSGDIGIPKQTTDNCLHVVQVSGGPAELRYVTIRGGRADAGFPDDRGSGLRIASGTLQATNCVFSYNYSLSGGTIELSGGADAGFDSCKFLANSTAGSGGAVILNGASADFTNCDFVQNSADISGGAIADFSGTCTLADCKFSNNSAVFFGGGFYQFGGDAQIDDSTFNDNLVINAINVSFDGGGAYYNDTGLGTLTACLFDGNVTSDDGGAVLNHAGDVTLDRCVFRQNWSADRGGAVYSYAGPAEVKNSSFVGNTAVSQGGAIHNSNFDVVLKNVTLVLNSTNGNTGGVWNTGAILNINSSILWGNSDATGNGQSAQVDLGIGSATINYSCLQGWTGSFGGIGNIADPPLLVDSDGPDNVPGTADDNIHLTLGSPCLNAADPGMPPLKEADLDGQPRRMGCITDIGADEVAIGPDHSGDMDGNGVIDGRDIQLFGAALLDTAPPGYDCVADIDVSDEVDLVDLALFIDLALGNS